MRTTVNAIRFESLAKRLWYVAFFVTAALLVNVSILQPAYAYVDPSVMTYTIQALAGVAVALGAVAGVAFRRTRKTLFKLFKIDENANKTIEEPISRVKNDGFGYVSFEQEAAVARASEKKIEPPASKKRRALMSVLASTFLVFTLCVVAPLELYIPNQADLIIRAGALLPLIFGSAAAIAVLLALILFLFKGKAHTVAISIVFALGLCCYLQAMFMNAGLPMADGQTIDLGAFLPITIISFVVWAAVIAGSTISSLKKRRLSHNALAAIAIVLVFVQAVGIGSLLLNTDKTSVNKTTGVPSAMSDWYVTQDGLFEIGSKNNVVVFVLDTVDGNYVKQILEKDPHALDGFTGFTNYTNCSAMMIPTRNGIPFLLTGIMPQTDESWKTYWLQRYERSTFLPSIANAGYSIGLYSDTLSFDKIDTDKTREALAASTLNLHDVDNNSIVNYPAALKVLYRSALYRDSLWLVKPIFWIYTDLLNREIIDPSPRPDAQTFYKMDDLGFYDSLRSKGLTIDDRGYDGTFKFIHLNGAHTPFSINENAEYIGEWWSTAIAQSQGILRVVQTYCDKLKELGLYDDATIIITADHGEWWFSDTPMEYPTSSMMLVKQAGQSVGAPVESNVPASHLDFQATVLDAMGLGEFDGNDGKALRTLTNESRTRNYYHTRTNYVTDTGVFLWQIDGDIADWASWNDTGIWWNFPEGDYGAETANK